MLQGIRLVIITSLQNYLHERQTSSNVIYICGITRWHFGCHRALGANTESAAFNDEVSSLRWKYDNLETQSQWKVKAYVTNAEFANFQEQYFLNNSEANIDIHEEIFFPHVLFDSCGLTYMIWEVQRKVLKKQFSLTENLS